MDYSMSQVIFNACTPPETHQRPLPTRRGGGEAPRQPVAHVTNQLLLQEWQAGRRGRVACPGCSRKKEELKIGMANSESTDRFSLAARSSRVDLGQGRVGRKPDLFSTPAFASGQWRTRRGGRAPRGQQRAAEGPRPQAACACHRRKETKAAARRTQSQRPARTPGPGRTRGRRPGRAQAAP